MPSLTQLPVAPMRSRCALLVVLSAALAACGGGSGGGGVTNPPVVQKLGSITASPATIDITAGRTSAITVAAVDEAGLAIAGASGFTYQSSAVAVAEVSGTGTVLGISAGSATITVSLSLGGVTKTATVNTTVSGTLGVSANVAAGTASNDFQPALVGIARGGKVTFSFGQLEHNVTFDGGGGAPASIGNSTQTTVDRTFTTAGNFAYHCTIHAGMNGQVFVR
ncbi:MAG: plastocyanin/azurin family copper-binding protein [Gemmatimonadaceae bacterium]